MWTGNLRILPRVLLLFYGLQHGLSIRVNDPGGNDCKHVGGNTDEYTMVKMLKLVQSVP